MRPAGCAGGECLLVLQVVYVMLTSWTPRDHRAVLR